MRALLVVVILLAVLALVGLVRIGGRVEYAQSGLKAWAKVCGVSILLFPKEKKDKTARKEKKQNKPKKAKKPKEKKESSSEPPPQKGGTLKLVLQLLPIGVEALGALKKRIRIDRLVVHYTAGGEDAAQVALGYGRLSGGAGVVLALLNENFQVKRQEVTMDVDFLAEEPTIYLDGALSIRVGQVVYLAVRYGLACLRVFLRHKKTQTGAGVQNPFDGIKKTNKTKKSKKNHPTEENNTAESK